LKDPLMTAQEHIDAIGRALAKSEEAVKATPRDGKNIVAFSGGTDKPPVTDPDKPVKP